MNKWLKLLLGTGLYVLEQTDHGATRAYARSAKDRASDGINDLRDAVQDRYEVASNRFTNASRAIRGEDSRVLGNSLRFAAGVGIGVGLGFLLAPASGEDTRDAIVDKVHDIGDRVRQRFTGDEALATGTNA